MDSFFNHASTLDSPARSAANAVPSDNADLPQFSRAIYVGTGGHVSVQMVEGMQVTYKDVPGGIVLPIRIRKLHSTGTTADNIIAMW